ncbi:MAG: hypothetical protein LBQ73_10390 [Tannerellaceae bacterium]|jgi:hypothetical protein|nr:hypothetical protein [Tannerellaceae bacterium]
MKIEFRIEEKMPDIIAEILHSDKWRSIVKNKCACLQRVVVEDFMDNTIAFVEIWKQEIHIKIACSCATYRIFCRQNHVICEYIGALGELLDHQPFPKLTPVKDLQHILDDCLISGK